MADSFETFSSAVRSRFAELAKETLYVVDAERDAIWEKYLASFPARSNPIYRERTEHDCSCCRHFIRDIGHVVAIQNGALASVWDLNGLPGPYQVVADALSAFVKSLAIKDVFLTPFSKHGVALNRGLINGSPVQFRHFSIEVPPRLVSKKCDEKRGDIRTTHAVLMRGLTEITPEAVSTVADLIDANAIYRGREFQKQVLEFQALQARAKAAKTDAERDMMGWHLVDSPVARLRNTVIGTLLQDLSDGVDIEKAVRAYEIKVAPQNYKRPTALITKAMVEAAMRTIDELGLEQALERRHARISDVSVNSVLFVDNAVRGAMKDGIKGLLMDQVKPASFDPKKAEEIGVDDFMSKVLPKTTGLSLYLENKALGNFVSMTAPVHEGSRSLFRWDNDFAWSYDGNVTDSIKEKVKRAGGMVEGVDLRVSLAWFNFDDLDLHCRLPNGSHVYYAQKHGILDVDMNAGGGQTRDPVENMRWPRLNDGLYTFCVHQFSRRESIDVGFTVEIESALGVETLSYSKAVSGEVPVCSIYVERGRVVDIRPGKDVKAGSIPTEKWGLKTLHLTRVNSVLLSPNHWDGNAVGNKHWFFILEGCKNPLPTRGIYNEFLHPRLEKHRRVFEVLGDKTKCPVEDSQLSGVGFSSTKPDKVTVVATGPTLNKAYTIVF